MEQSVDERCALAGLNVGQSAPYADYTCMVKQNLLGMAKDEDWIIPHSEMAIDAGIAGKEILVLCRHRRTSDTRVVVKTAKGCTSSFGIEGELVSHELKNAVERVFGK